MTRMTSKEEAQDAVKVKMLSQLEIDWLLTADPTKAGFFDKAKFAWENKTLIPGFVGTAILNLLENLNLGKYKWYTKLRNKSDVNHPVRKNAFGFEFDEDLDVVDDDFEDFK